MIKIFYYFWSGKFKGNFSFLPFSLLSDSTASPPLNRSSYLEKLSNISSKKYSSNIQKDKTEHRSNMEFEASQNTPAKAVNKSSTEITANSLSKLTSSIAGS